jgi:hypothetical protein
MVVFKPTSGGSRDGLSRLTIVLGLIRAGHREALKGTSQAGRSGSTDQSDRRSPERRRFRLWPSRTSRPSCGQCSLYSRTGRSTTSARCGTNLTEHFSLTPEDLAAQIPSGRAKQFANRVGWATTHLYQTGLIGRPRRSVYRITDRGRTVLAQCPERVDLKVLAQFEEFHEFRGRARSADGHARLAAPGR